MSASTLNFSATLPPFYNVSGSTTNYSNSNISATGNLAISTATDSATGQPTTAITSSVTSNGLNYAATNASINGNLLTVDYVSTNAANAPQNSGVAANLLSSHITGTGVNFSPQQSTSHGNSVTTLYSTSPNKTFNETIKGAATSTGSSTDDQNISLKSLALVGNSIIATYQITDGLPDNTAIQAAAQPPVTTASVSVASPSPNANLGATFSNSGVASIGDVLASSSSLTAGSSFTAAPLSSTEAQAADSSSLGSILAASLNPGVNFSPNSSLQVADFIDTSANAFPTSAPAPPDNTNTNTNTGSDNSGGNAPAPAATDNNQNAGSSPASDGTNSGTVAAVGIYNDVANASASTIRGTGLDTVA